MKLYLYLTPLSVYIKLLFDSPLGVCSTGICVYRYSCILVVTKAIAVFRRLYKCAVDMFHNITYEGTGNIVSKHSVFSFRLISNSPIRIGLTFIARDLRFLLEGYIF